MAKSIAFSLNEVLLVIGRCSSGFERSILTVLANSFVLSTIYPQSIMILTSYIIVDNFDTINNDAACHVLWRFEAVFWGV